MKKLTFKRLSIISKKERKARTEVFSPATNLIIGENQTGKSSFIKSIYTALGADVSTVNVNWTNAEAYLLLNFEVSGTEYYCLRIGKNICLFDGSKNLIWTEVGVTKASERIGKILGISVLMPDKKDGLMSLWTSAIFMPFYIDQDKGLNETWDSFARLNAFRDYKNNLVDFHTGIKPKEYYHALHLKTEATVEKSQLEKERYHLEYAQNKLDLKTLDSDIDFSLRDFETEIEKLLKELDSFNVSRAKVKRSVSKLQSDKATFLEEIALAQATLKELDDDVKFLKKIDTSEIICPTCNTVHENDFANNFRLIGDADLCRSFLISSEERLRDIQIELTKTSRQLEHEEEKINRINGILNETRGEMTLKDLIQQESRRQAHTKLENEKSKIDIQIGKIDERIRIAANDMKANSSKERKAEITTYFATKLRSFVTKLNIANPPEKIFEKVRPIISETGSEYPRLLLAYYFAILHTIDKFSSAVFAPIVFDTAQHQDQDDKNINAMIKFVFEEAPAGSQIIFGTVKMHDYDYTGNRISMKDSNSLLNKASFKEVDDEFTPFLEQFFESIDKD